MLNQHSLIKPEHYNLHEEQMYCYIISVSLVLALITERKRLLNFITITVIVHVLSISIIYGSTSIVQYAHSRADQKCSQYSTCIYRLSVEMYRVIFIALQNSVCQKLMRLSKL